MRKTLLLILGALAFMLVLALSSCSTGKRATASSAGHREVSGVHAVDSSSTSSRDTSASSSSEEVKKTEETGKAGIQIDVQIGGSGTDSTATVTVKPVKDSATGETEYRVTVPKGTTGVKISGSRETKKTDSSSRKETTATAGSAGDSSWFTGLDGGHIVQDTSSTESNRSTVIGAGGGIGSIVSLIVWILVIAFLLYAWYRWKF